MSKSDDNFDIIRIALSLSTKPGTSCHLTPKDCATILDEVTRLEAQISKALKVVEEFAAVTYCRPEENEMWMIGAMVEDVKEALK